VKSESEVDEKFLRRSDGKPTPMYLLFVGNDTVPISVRRGGGRLSTECCLIVAISLLISTKTFLF